MRQDFPTRHFSHVTCHILWRLEAAFRCNFQGAFKGKLDLACGLFARVSVSHDAGPFNDLSNKAFVTFFGRIPNSDFILARVGFHSCLFRMLLPAVTLQRIT